MDASIKELAARFLREQKNNKRWQMAFLCMAVFVALGTVAALMMTGQAVTHKAKVLDCKLENHVHTEACYGEESGLVCGYAGYVVHTHNDDCMDAQGNTVCLLPEVEAHAHVSDCYYEEKLLICVVEETPGHQHLEDCYLSEKGELTCKKEEGAGAHIHSDKCYKTQTILGCNVLELHSHDAETCYDETGSLLCSIPVLEEHVHGEDCFKVIELTEEEVAIPEDNGDAEVEEPAEVVSGGDEVTVESEVVSSGDEATAESDVVSGGDAGTDDVAEPEDVSGGDAEGALLQQVYADESVEITVWYSVSANIPEDAVFFAEKQEIEGDTTEEEMSRSRYKVGFYVDGVEVEPEDSVRLSIRFLDGSFADAEEIKVIHYLDGIGGETETIEAESEVDENGITEATFDMDSFSYIDILGVTDGNRLTEDGAYIEQFSINSCLDGSLPFDETEGDGNDLNATNNIVRTFDTVSYNLGVTMDSYQKPGEADSTSYVESRVHFAFVLPCTEDQASFVLEAMPWMDQTTGYEYKIVEENGQQILYCSSLLLPAQDGGYTIPGTTTVNVSIYVKNMENGAKIKPEFYAWLEGNDVHEDGWTESDGVYGKVHFDTEEVCSNQDHNRAELVKAEASEITVSAAMKLNVGLTPLNNGVKRTWDFSSNSNSVENQKFGTVTGTGTFFQIEVQLHNDNRDKGLRGLAYPNGEPITFDITLETKTQKTGQPLKSDTYDFTPLLYTYGGNQSGIIPYNTGNNKAISCYNGGNWSVVQDAEDPSILHVTISEYEINGIFPIATAFSYNGNRTIAENIGHISTGQIDLLLPHYNVRMGGTDGDVNDRADKVNTDFSGNVNITVKDIKLQATSVDGTSLEGVSDNSNQMKKDDDAKSLTVNLAYEGGGYTNVIKYIARDSLSSPLSNGGDGNGRDWTYPGIKIGILGGPWATYNKGFSENTVIGYDEFIKIDADAVEFCDEYTGSKQPGIEGLIYQWAYHSPQKVEAPEMRAPEYEGVKDGIVDYYLYDVFPLQEVNGIKHDGLLIKLRYVVKTDGKNWDSEEQMRTAVQDADFLTYYDNFQEATAAGKVVGLLFQIRGELTPTGTTYCPRVHFYAKIKDDESLIGNSYMLTDTFRIWSQNSLSKLNLDKQEGEELITSIPMEIDYGEDIKKAAASYAEPRYYKLEYKEDGSYEGDEPTGIGAGDTVYIVGYTTGVNIEVANASSEGEAKVYKLDAGQNVVDFRIRPSIDLSKSMVDITDDAGATTSVTVTATLPEGLSYINGSSYWGGTYHTTKLGRQGRVTDGLLLEENATVPYTYIYTNGAGEQSEVTLQITLTTQENADGTTTLVYKFDGVPLQDSSFSQGGLTNLLYCSAFIESREEEYWTLEEQAIISGDWDRRDPTTANGNKSTTSITVYQAKGEAISEIKDSLYNEIDSTLGWLITYNNNSILDRTNDALLLSVAPYSGFHGTYNLSGWSLNVDKLGESYTDDELKLYYITDESVCGKDAGSYTIADIESGWTKLDLPAKSTKDENGYISLSEEQIEQAKDATAWVLIGTLRAGSTIEVHMTILPEGNIWGDSYQNVASFRTTEGLGLASYATTYIAARALEGLTWLDSNYDGIQDADETKLSAMKVSLMKLKDNGNAENAEDYEPFCYPGTDIPVVIETDQQVSVRSREQTVTDIEALVAEYENAVTDYQEGRYKFTDLPEGIFAVKFEVGEHTMVADYVASPENQGTDDTVDSDGVPTYNENGGGLKHTFIRNIEMPDVNEIKATLYESKYHDSGFSIQGYEMPDTGGMGSYLYTFGGMAVIACGLGCLLAYKKKAEQN